MKLFPATNTAVGTSGLFLSAAVAWSAQTNSGETGGWPRLAPAYPEIPETFWQSHGEAVMACSAGLVLLLALLIRQLLQPKPAAVCPPEAVAQAALGKLSGQPEDGMCLSRLSQIVRRYFIVAFEIPAGELTTAEFCAAISGHPTIGADLAGAVSQLLRQCDERKFGAAPAAAPLNAAGRAVEVVAQAGARRVQSPATISPRP